MKKHVAPVSMLMMAATLVAGGAAPARATGPRTNGRIVFSSCDAVSCQIFTVNPDGTALQQVTHGGNNWYPDWSPDGGRIVFSGDAGGTRAIWIVDANGSNARPLTPSNLDSNLWPRFAPDGKTVLFTHFPPTTDGEIYSIRSDGTHMRVVLRPTPGSGQSINDAVPSPDGKHLAFLRFHVAGIIARVYVTRADGTHQRPITPPRLEGWGPDWRPDAKQVVFASNRDRPNSAIFTVNTDATHVVRLTNPLFPFDDFDPAYSPQGNRIVFASDRRYTDRCCADLFTMRPDGSGIRRIQLGVTGTFVFGPRWGAAPLLSGPSDRVWTARRPTSAPGAEAFRGLCAYVPDLARLGVCRLLP